MNRNTEKKWSILRLLKLNPAVAIKEHARQGLLMIIERTFFDQMFDFS